MSRAETSKVTAYATLGPPADVAVVSKVVAFAILVPGDDGIEPPPERQSFCYGQRIRRG